MTKIVQAVADRLVSLVVPQLRASACCNYPGWYEYKCTGGIRWRRHCRYNCACVKSCSSWRYLCEGCC